MVEAANTGDPSGRQTGMRLIVMLSALLCAVQLISRNAKTKEE